MLCTLLLTLYTSFCASLHFRLFKDIYFFICIRRPNLKAASTQATRAFMQTELQYKKPIKCEEQSVRREEGRRAWRRAREQLEVPGDWGRVGGPGTVRSRGGASSAPALHMCPLAAEPLALQPRCQAILGQGAMADGCHCLVSEPHSPPQWHRHVRGNILSMISTGVSV